MSFGYSGKKDDVSMKLKAQNMKNTRKQTSQLEIDSRRMEERLQELKLAMMNEKEERERNQGMYWQSGQVGKLGSYGEEIVKKSSKTHSAKSQDKKRKLKVLKGDEPLAVQTERPKGPGTMKYIADRKVSGKENKIKGPKCGQCEEKGAQVSCLECAEEYCAACFAAFHLKGALKKHRSTPIGTSLSRTPRAVGSVNSTPRPPHEDSSRATPTDVSIIMDSARSSARSNRTQPDSGQNSKMLVPHPPGASKQCAEVDQQEESLLDGAYDERQAALEFQQAIAEWRTGKKKTTEGEAVHEEKRVVVSPARTPVYQMDEGTGTDNSIYPDSQPVDIHFHGTLSYAEKLMLKKHRRHQLAPVSSDGSVYEGSTGGPSSLSDYHLSDIEVLNQDALDDNLRMSRVDVASLLGSAHTASQNSDPYRSESRVSIIELDTKNLKRRSLRGLEQTSEYEVTEVAENEVVAPPTPSALARMKCETLWETRQAFSTPQASARTPRNKPDNAVTTRNQPKSGKKSLSKPTSARKSHEKVPNMESRADDHHHNNYYSNNDLSTAAAASCRKTTNPRSTPDHRNTLSSTTSSRDMDVNQSSQNTAPPSGYVQNKSRPASVQKSSYRPQSRAKSRNDRPQSRAKSRAESRLSIYGEGTLTKQPSSALKDIAQLANQLTSQIVTNTEYRLGLGEFFTAGVEPDEVPEEQERTLTPSKNRPKSSRPVSSRRPKSGRQQEGGIEKWKISNKLYSMTPRSWKPDFSLADTVTDTQVQSHLGDETVQEMDRLAADAADEYVKSAQQGGEGAAEIVNNGLERLQAAIESRASPRRSKGLTSLVKPTSRPTTASKRPPSRPDTAASGRVSRMIVMDGEDLSHYDGLEEDRKQVEDDRETLDQLEWELASQSGRITDDGRISRMLDDEADDEGMDTGHSGAEVLVKSKADHGFDIQNHLRESELMDDFEEMEAAMMEEDEVKRLF